MYGDSAGEKESVIYEKITVSSLFFLKKSVIDKNRIVPFISID